MSYAIVLLGSQYAYSFIVITLFYDINFSGKIIFNEILVWQTFMLLKKSNAQ